jgi:hypothetical protein
MGYTILIVFVVYAFSVFGAFIFGHVKGRKAEQTQAALRKAESDKVFEVVKEEIREEVYNHAENEKAQLSSGTGRERFDAINNSLRNNKN